MAARPQDAMESRTSKNGDAGMSDYQNACVTDSRQGEAIRDVLSHIGDKWTLLVVGVLSSQLRLRFTELHRQVPGISQRMLTVTLRHLERDGLVRRTVHAEVPPRVEYELTDIGTTLIAPAHLLARWATDSLATVLDSRARYDAAESASAAPVETVPPQR